MKVACSSGASAWFCVLNVNIYAALLWWVCFEGDVPYRGRWNFGFLRLCPYVSFLPTWAPFILSPGPGDGQNTRGPYGTSWKTSGISHGKSVRNHAIKPLRNPVLPSPNLSSLQETGDILGFGMDEILREGKKKQRLSCYFWTCQGMLSEINPNVGWLWNGTASPWDWSPPDRPQ